jgi:hypothetical protein
MLHSERGAKERRAAPIREADQNETKKELRMRKFIIAATAVASLAVPAVSMADTGVSTHAPAAAAIGYDVSAGNYNYMQPGGQDGFTSTGQDRSSYAGTPGAVAGLIAGARATTAAGYAGAFPAPGQAN